MPLVSWFVLKYTELQKPNHKQGFANYPQQVIIFEHSGSKQGLLCDGTFRIRSMCVLSPYSINMLIPT